MAIEVVNRQRFARVDARRLAELADATLASVGRANSRVTVVLVRDRFIRGLNRKHRHSDSVTDVLSFPAGQGWPGDDSQENPDLGDIAISIETALHQAKRAGHSIQRELDELLIHGLLHLCGYDHATDRGEMNRLELKLRRKLLDES